MKKYDFAKAIHIIEQHKNDIIQADLGMAEDWWWTAEPVFENGEYTVDLHQKDLKIAGISGSSWATPSILLTFKDGNEKFYACYTGESTRSGPPWPIYGPLSGPAQGALPEVEKYAIEEKES